MNTQRFSCFLSISLTVDKIFWVFKSFLFFLYKIYVLNVVLVCLVAFSLRYICYVLLSPSRREGYQENRNNKEIMKHIKKLKAFWRKNRKSLKTQKVFKVFKVFQLKLLNTLWFSRVSFFSIKTYNFLIVVHGFNVFPIFLVAFPPPRYIYYLLLGQGRREGHQENRKNQEPKHLMFVFFDIGIAWTLEGFQRF